MIRKLHRSGAVAIVEGFANFADAGMIASRMMLFDKA